MRRKSEQAGTFELLARLPHQVVTLIKLEIDNAKREVSAKAKRMGIGAVAIVVALFILFFALEALVVAAIAGVAVVWPVWLSALVVAGGLIILAALAILGGFLLMKRNVPVPGKTFERVEGDLAAMGEVRLNAEVDDAHLTDSRLPRPPGKEKW